MTSKNQPIASSIINFLSSLDGLHEHKVDGRAAVLDLLTGIAYVPNLDYEDGEMLTMIAPGGGVIAQAVITYKVVETYLVRYAQSHGNFGPRHREGAIRDDHPTFPFENWQLIQRQ